MSGILKIGGTNVKRLSFILCMGATFLGSGRSPASVELLGQITGDHIGFMEYMWYQFVPSMVLGVATCMALWYPLAGMPGNIDNMKTPAKLIVSGYELIVTH